MSKNNVDIEFRFGDSDTMEPDLSVLDKDKQNMKYLADCFSFELHNSGDVEIEKYEVIDNGLKDVKLSDDKSYTEGIPMPVVRFYLKEMPKDIDEFRTSVWESAYIFTVPGLNDDDPMIYEDYSGKTRELHLLSNCGMHYCSEIYLRILLFGLFRLKKNSYYVLYFYLLIKHFYFLLNSKN